MRLALFLSLLLVGCAKQPLHLSGVAHKHPYHIHVGHPLSHKEKKEISKIIDNVFLEIDETYNHWNPDSELSRALLTPKVEAILSLAHSFYDLTEGWYDPTLGGPIKTFKETGNLPSKSMPVTYDLDGMLKGFTIDLILERLFQKGYQNLYVEWGGDIRICGNHPTGRFWRVLVDDEPLDLIDAALATSGCQEQLWDIGSHTYTHIINPHTLEMLEVKSGHVHKVSVLAPTCALADALATACMACGSLESAYAFAKKIKKEYPEVEFWITSYEL
ncbi:MAG: FAD:protein FMN transferase [Simkaniaceae bacterium]|nr:MAG: FAD:protein FMN transferase [Simkaniaceae bacterium]